MRLHIRMILLAGMVAFMPAARGADITLDASVDRTGVSLGESVQLSLTFSGTQNVPAPELPPIDGFQSRYLGPSTSISIVNGRMSSSISHRYLLIPLKEGKFEIGPFSFYVGGENYTTGPIRIEVVGRGAAPPAAGAPAPDEGSGQIATGDRIFAVIEADRRRAYLNEIIPVKVKLYVTQLNIKEFQYPEVEHEGLSLGAFKDFRQSREVLGEATYDVVIFETTAFGTRSGKLTLGPARIECNLLIKNPAKRPRSMFDNFFRDDFFDSFPGNYRVYPIVVESAPIPVEVMDFPAEGRPEDFTGAVGDFSFTMDAGPKEVNVGDPITLKMKVEGRGNFDTVNAPRLGSTDGFKVYEPERKQEDGVKNFEQVLIPRNDTVTEIPPASFSFFDPESGRYRTITKGPIPVRVKRPEKEEELKIVEMPPSPGRLAGAEKLGRDIIYIKETPGRLRKKDGYLFENRIYLYLHLVPLLALIAAHFYRKRTLRLRTDLRYARRLRAPARARKGIAEAGRLLKEGKARDFYDSVFRTLREYLGDRLHVASGGITGRVVDEVLKDRGLDEGALERIRGVFRDCDQARYAPSAFGKDRMANTFRALREAIDDMERRKI